MRGWFWFYNILGSILGGVALASLCVKVFHVGLTPVATDIISSYRAVFHPLMTFLLGWLHWVWPDWHFSEELKDAYSLSFIGGFGSARGLVAADAIFTPEEKAGFMERAVVIFLTGSILGLTFVGLFAVIVSPFMLLPLADSPTDVRQARSMAFSIFAALFGTALFFALNYASLRS